MKKLTSVLFVVLISISCLFSQEASKIEFQNYKNDKIVTLKQGREITVICNSFSNGIDTIQKSYLGSLQSENENNLYVTIETEYTKMFSPHDKFTEYYKKYSYDTVISIKEMNIDHILVQRKVEPVIQFATFVSLASLLVLAPISGINLKDWTFNSNAYYNIAKPAAVSTIITGVLYFNIGDKKLKVKK